MTPTSAAVEQPPSAPPASTVKTAKPSPARTKTPSTVGLLSYLSAEPTGSQSAWRAVWLSE